MSTAPDFSMLSTLALRPLTIFSRMPGCWWWKVVQIRRQEEAGDRVAGADGQCAQQQLLGLGELVLSSGQQSQGTADVLIEHLPLPGQG